MHSSIFQPLGNAFTGTFPNAGLSASAYLESQVFAKRVTQSSASSSPGSGDVVGPASATDNAITRYDLTTGKLIQNSAAFVDDSGRVLLGDATARLTQLTAQLQVNGTSNDGTAVAFSRWSNDATPVNFFFNKARGAAIGTNTIVQSGDVLGSISFAGANGSTFDSAASIQGYVDDSPGASNDMPGGLDFFTTPNATATLTRAIRIKNTGTILVNTTTETTNAGRLQFAASTSSAQGIAFGADVQLYRGAANILVSPDMISARDTAGTPYTDTTAAASLVGTTANYALSLCDSARGVNDRKAELSWGNGNLDMRFINDGYSAVANIIRVTGGQSTGVTLFTIPVATAVAIGHTASITVGNAGKLQVTGTTAATSQSQVSGFANDATTAGSIALSKSRSGTAGTNTIVQSGDVLGRITAYGADGTNYDPAAQISFESDGTPGSGTDMPGRTVFSTSPDGSATLAERMRIDKAGNVVVNTAAIATNATDGFLYVPTCAGTPTGTPTAYTGRAPIVIDTTNNKLYFYSTGAWRDAGP